MPTWLVDVAVLAVGASLSPSLAACVIALITQPDHPRQRAKAFLAGAVAALVVWAALVSSAAWSLVKNAAHSIERYETWIYSAIGLALIAFGLWKAYRMWIAKKPQRKDRSRDLGLTTGSYWRPFSFGIVMQGRNVTTILMFLAAQQVITTAAANVISKVLVTFAVIFVATTMVWLPLLIPSRTVGDLQERLEPARRWLESHEEAIVAVAALGVGGYLIVRVLTTVF